MFNLVPFQSLLNTVTQTWIKDVYLIFKVYLLITYSIFFYFFLSKSSNLCKNWEYMYYWTVQYWTMALRSGYYKPVSTPTNLSTCPGLCFVSNRRLLAQCQNRAAIFRCNTAPVFKIMILVYEAFVFFSI